MPEKLLRNKKIAMVIAFRDFRDIEYFIPRDALQRVGAQVVTVSSQKGTAIGADGGDAEIDLLISEINPADFDAVVFVGGPGALRYLDNEDSYQVAKETILQDKLIAAICISPVILAKSGVLSGKKATVWSSPMDKTPVRILEQNGAIYQDEEVAADGKIVTANGPAAARRFAEKIIEVLIPTPN
jgi:protease I